MILAVIGLLDSIYLIIVKIVNSRALCVPGLGDCWSVNTSSYSEVLGIPVAVFGVLAYLALIALLWLEPTSSFWQRNSPLAIFGISLTGVLYSAYLTYLELFVIKAICPFCVLSALVILAIFVFSLMHLARPQSIG